MVYFWLTDLLLAVELTDGLLDPTFCEATIRLRKISKKLDENQVG